MIVIFDGNPLIRCPLIRFLINLHSYSRILRRLLGSDSIVDCTLEALAGIFVDVPNVVLGLNGDVKSFLNTPLPPWPPN